MLSPGQTLPAFTLTDKSGQSYESKKFLEEGPAVFVLFKASCPTCQLLLPFLDRFEEQNSPAKVVLISQDDARTARDFRAHFRLQALTLVDQAPAYAVSNAFGITHVPSIFYAEPDGRLSFVSSGFSRAELEELAQMSSVALFRENEAVPDWRAG